MSPPRLKTNKRLKICIENVQIAQRINFVTKKPSAAAGQFPLLICNLQWEIHIQQLWIVVEVPGSVEVNDENPWMFRLLVVRCLVTYLTPENYRKSQDRFTK